MPFFPCSTENYWCNEVPIFASLEFKSESHRNKVMKLIFKGPALGEMMTKKPLFDSKRMVYGSFKILVEI